jgi:hypothetical protein
MCRALLLVTLEAAYRRENKYDRMKHFVTGAR